ncbi:MAG: hypothetical protein JWN99_1542, partial [Ilumatobacteraceae bacterium]|nr:hypothetical protein [Ilumatobacteraceae bacterium]
MTMHARATTTRVRRLVAMTLTAALVAAACSDKHDQAAPNTSTTTTGTSTTQPDGQQGTGITTGIHPFSGIRLSKGTAQAPAGDDVAVVDGAALDESAIAAVTDRLPPWTDATSLVQAFKWPAQTLHPPQTGATSDVPFPAVDQTPPPDVSSGDLHVLRVQPEGDVAIAPFTTITFDQPMVPVGTVGQLAAADVPAIITPAVPGRWQWIGTRTLRFDADSDVIDRLPMATTYTVQVPSGTRSATGGQLADAVTFQFTTPAVTVRSFQPTGDSQSLTPVFVATFDQRIDQAAVLATVTVEADGDDHAVRLATADEIAADATAQQVVDVAPEGRWLAFRPVEPFAADAALTIEIGPQTPSAEGPNTTTEPQRYTAHTFQPLEITSVECGYGSGCVPGSEFDIVFNNPLDAALFDPSTVRVEPAIDGVSIGMYSNTIAIRGATAANTDYTVTLPAGVTDAFGQTLGDDDTRSISTGDAVPVLQQFGQPFTTVDPSADPPAVSVFSLGHDQLRVRAFSAQLTDWSQFAQQASDLMYGPASGSATPPWPVLFDKTIDVDGNGETMIETSVDLSEALPHGHGQLILMVEPTERYDNDSPEYWNNRPIVSWVQSTDLGVDAFADNDEVRAWVTDLATGVPVKGAAVQLLGSTEVASTDPSGVASLSVPAGGAPALMARVGDDVALLPNGYYGGGWGQGSSSDTAL